MKIIQLIGLNGHLYALTEEGKVFCLPSGYFGDDKNKHQWFEVPLPN